MSVSTVYTYTVAQTTVPIFFTKVDNPQYLLIWVLTYECMK